MNVSELTLLVLRVGFLLLLWLFVFAIVYALRSDLFGQRVRKLPTDAQPAPAFPAPAPAIPGPASTAETEPVRMSPPATDEHDIATVQNATRLVITSGARKGTELPLAREPLTIGRSSDSGLIVRDDYTSTHHARLMLWNDEWMLQDLDSTNGTFLGGQRVTVPTPVTLNTPVKVGTTTFELRR